LKLKVQDKAQSIAFQSPDGDSVVSHHPFSAEQLDQLEEFQSPDGDSVVSHAALDVDNIPFRMLFGFSPLTGIPWFPTRRIR